MLARAQVHTKIKSLKQYLTVHQKKKRKKNTRKQEDMQKRKKKHMKARGHAKEEKKTSWKLKACIKTKKKKKEYQNAGTTKMMHIYLKRKRKSRNMLKDAPPQKKKLAFLYPWECSMNPFRFSAPPLGLSPFWGDLRMGKGLLNTNPSPTLIFLNTCYNINRENP